MLIFSHIFFAQSWAFGLPENIIFIIIGLFLMGFPQSQMFIPVVPYMTEYLIEEYK